MNRQQTIETLNSLCDHFQERGWYGDRGERDKVRYWTFVPHGLSFPSVRVRLYLGEGETRPCYWALRQHLDLTGLEVEDGKVPVPSAKIEYKPPAGERMLPTTLSVEPTVDVIQRIWKKALQGVYGRV